MWKKVFVASALVCVSAAALADQERGVTFGVGVGRNDYSLNPDAVGADGSFNTTGWQAFGGYRFSRYIAAEAAYLDGGSQSNTVSGVRAKLDQSAYGASALGTLPFAESFAVYARAGLLHGDIRASLCDSTGCVRDKESDQSFWYGVGLWGLLDGAQVRLEYSRASFDLMDAEVTSLSIAWLF